MTTYHAETTDQHHDDHQAKDDQREEETRTNASKSKTHTHASRSRGARRGAWRARPETPAGAEEHALTTTTGKHLHDARHPAERYAATFLAIAQRNLGLARVSSPAVLAAKEPENPDPVADYAAWVERMEESERFHRLAAERCVADARRTDDGPTARRLLLDPADIPEFTDSVMRARGAIAAMLGPDPSAARAAQHDVLVRWYADDEADGWTTPC